MIKVIERKVEGLDYVVYADGEWKQSFNQMSDDWAYTNSIEYMERLKKLEGDENTLLLK